jgi:molybdate transport system substrate-binding protein
MVDGHLATCLGDLRRAVDGCGRRLLVLAVPAVVLGLGISSVRAAPKPQPIVVFAASSLKESFEGLVPAFEKAHPEAKVQLAFAGSQELRTQIEQGARADVFASADWKHMAALGKQKLVGTPEVFARNEPVVVVPRANPAGIHAFTDLPKTRRLVVGAPEVPIGAYTARIFEAAGKKLGPELRTKLEASVVSRELNVRQVLAKVTLGEADAGIVYRTDAAAAKDKVELIPIPSDLNVVAEYPIAPLTVSAQPALAGAWVAFVLSAEGQRRLAAAGFLPAVAPAERAAAGGPAPQR